MTRLFIASAVLAVVLQSLLQPNAYAAAASIAETRPPAKASTTQGARPRQSGESIAQELSGGTSVREQVTIRTKYAVFIPAAFSELPGWREDDLTQAWQAFRASCKALASRSAWSGACERSAAVPARANEAIRHFIEREFAVYQIRNPDDSPAGVITGYYEPLLNGSLRPTGKYSHPVYGVPADLLYLDSRTLPSLQSGIPAYATVQGRTVTPIRAADARRELTHGFYLLDLGDAKPDIRDKKLRVRIEGERIVPYYTRAAIEAGALAATQPLAWVDSASDLYSMQVQGSGKVQLPDGGILRLAYAEQNGQPFLPPVRHVTRGDASAPRGPLLRGLEVDLAEVDPDVAPAAPADDPDAPQTRGMQRPKAGAAQGRDVSPAVEQMVDYLLKNARIDGANASSRPSGTSASSPGKASGGAASGGAGYFTSTKGRFSFSSDPSYVFFRQIPDSNSGPIGALGVPLTPGRSVAVDPRTTPLGSPVYIATERAAGRAGRLNRLMLAQDTGGAIRGAVRADYFWGFGSTAGERAGTMKQNGQMWLLLPKSQARDIAGMARTRGGASGEGPECLVADEELCVD